MTFIGFPGERSRSKLFGRWIMIPPLPHSRNDAFPPKECRSIGRLGAICVVLIAAVTYADDASPLAVTEYESTPRSLISLLHEPYASAVTADGTRLATAHDDGSIILWDVKNARPTRRFDGHAGTVSSLAFDASGTRLASAGYDATVRVWDVATGESLHVLNGNGSRLTSVCISPDGQRVISGGYDKTVRLWNLQQPDAEPLLFNSHETTVRAAAFSPDGQHFATGDDAGTLNVWNTADPADVKTVDAHHGALRTLAFSPDGQLIVTGGDDGGVKLWATESLEQRELYGETDVRARHTAPVTAVVFSPDGRLLATADRQGEIQVGERSSTDDPAVLDVDDDEIIRLAFLPDAAALLSVGRDRTVHFWRSKLPLSPRLATVDGGDVRLWSVAVSPAGRFLFAGGWHRYLASWDLETGQGVRQFDGFDGTIDAVALTSDGSHIACCGWKEKTVAIFDTATGEKSAEFATDSTVRCVRFSPDDRTLVAGCEDGSLRFWEWRTSAEPLTIQAAATSVYDVAFSPDGSQLVTCSGDWRKKEPGDVTFWRHDGEVWAEARKLGEHTQAVRSVVFNHDGSRAASAGEDGWVIVWNAATYVPLARLHNADGVRPIAFSPDGNRVAVGVHDGTINVWDIDRKEIVQRFQSEDDVFGISYSEDGTVLFSVSGESRIEIWPMTAETSTADRIRHWNTSPDKGPPP